LLFSKAIFGFMTFIRAEGFAESTIKLYAFNLNILQRFLGDKDLEMITIDDLRGFFVYLREEYPKVKGHVDKPLSGSTLQNHWKAMRTFFKWSEDEGLIKERPDRRIKMPDNSPKAVMPLSEEDVKALLKYTTYSSSINPYNRRSYKFKRDTALRDTALVLLLLDTGVRAGEASRLDQKDLDLESSHIFVRPFSTSQRKTKSRVIPLGKACQRALWKYISSLEDPQPADPVFTTRTGRRMGREVITELIKSLGNRAGVKNCHPHRLRHTFAIEYLRNGGDIFTLKYILGHSTLDMVQHYLQIAQTDVEMTHKRASPADKWRL
jgi:integrase/recombinase XerD